MDIRTVKVKMWGTTIGYLHRQDNGLREITGNLSRNLTCKKF